MQSKSPKPDEDTARVKKGPVDAQIIGALVTKMAKLLELARGTAPKIKTKMANTKIQNQKKMAGSQSFLKRKGRH